MAIHIKDIDQTQADWQDGTLTGVEATSDGILRLEKQFNAPVNLHLPEVYGTATPPSASMARVTFGPVDATGLTKNNAKLQVDLKCSDWSKLSSEETYFGITSSGRSDVEGWHYNCSSLNITSKYQTFELPLSSFVTHGGELDPSKINYIRWYAYFSSPQTICWRNAKLIGGYSTDGGTRLSPQINLSPVGQVEGSLVEWEAKEVMLDFDGVDDHVVVPEPSECIPGGHSYTIEFWAKVHPDNQSWSIPLEWPGGDRIYVGFHEGLGWKHMNTTDGIRRDTGYVLMDGKNKWVFVQAVLNRDTQEQIIRAFDGTWHSNTIDASPGETNPSGNLYIPSHAFPHHGLLMEMRFWHKVRSQSDAENDMYKQLSGHETSLVGYWPMDEGSGSTVYDKSGNENHGTIHGASWTPTDIKIETRHSIDGGSTWSDWAECTNGEPIPGLEQDTDVSDGLLECRQTLSTSDVSTTPKLNSLTLEINSRKFHGASLDIDSETNIEETMRAYAEISMATVLPEISQVLLQKALDATLMVKSGHFLMGALQQEARASAADWQKDARPQDTWTKTARPTATNWQKVSKG